MRRTVAALVQPFSRGVERETDAVLHDRELHLIQRAGFGKPLDAVHALEPLDDRLLDDLLAVADGEKLRVETVSFYGKGGVAGQHALPGQGLCPLKELVKAPGLKAAELQQHTLAHAQIDVGAGNVPLVAGKADAAVVGGDIFHFQPAQLVGDGRLKPQQAGNT